MAKPQRYQRNHHSRRPRHEYRAGDVVYFHAQPIKNKDEKNFICKGVVLRQPFRDSKVYKVAIVAVNPHSILSGHQPELATTLLGRKYPRGPQQLMNTPSAGVLGTAYDKIEWLEVSAQQEKEIRQAIGK